jgi:hypothetical protein
MILSEVISQTQYILSSALIEGRLNEQFPSLLFRGEISLSRLSTAMSLNISFLLVLLSYEGSHR